jgi:hypothetical protein
MADFAGTVRHWMGQRGMSVRGLARAAHYDQGLLSKVLNVHRPHSPYLAARLDAALGAGGEMAAAAGAEPSRRPQRALARRKTPRAVEALQVAMSAGADGAETMGIASEGLAELVQHYAYAVAVAPSAAVYDELLAVRSFAGTLPASSPARRRATRRVQRRRRSGGRRTGSPARPRTRSWPRRRCVARRSSATWPGWRTPGAGRPRR